jgi:hypothetical protein
MLLVTMYNAWPHSCTTNPGRGWSEPFTFASTITTVLMHGIESAKSWHKIWVRCLACRVGTSGSSRPLIF